MAPYVLYHANCPDGFGAAFAAWKKFGNNAQYIPVKHGNPLPEMEAKSEIYIIDFAYDRQTLLTLAQDNQVQVLDHHKTAFDDLQGLDFAEFDMHRSGAVMAWNYFHPETEVPLLLQYIQDQDLWNWALPAAKEICTALSMYPFDFKLWDQLKIEQLQQEGTVVLRYKEQLVSQLSRKLDWFEILGHCVPAVNTPLFASELGNQLCLDHPEAKFSACYSELNGMRKFSLRSIGDNDVSAIARHFGGGGHPNASGMAVPIAGHPDIKVLELEP